VRTEGAELVFKIFKRNSIHALAICDSLMAISLSSQPISKFRVVCDPKSVFGRPLKNDVTTVAAIVYAGKIRSGYQTHRSYVFLDISSDWRIRQGLGEYNEVCVLLRFFGGRSLFFLSRVLLNSEWLHDRTWVRRVEFPFDWTAYLRHSAEKICDILLSEVLTKNGEKKRINKLKLSTTSKICNWVRMVAHTNFFPFFLQFGLLSVGPHLLFAESSPLRHFSVLTPFNA